jgi:hypothetical protein
VPDEATTANQNTNDAYSKAEDHECGQRTDFGSAYVQRLASSDNICEPKHVSITISRSHCIYKRWVHRLCCYVKQMAYQDKYTVDVTISRGRRVDYVKAVMTPATSRSKGCVLRRGFNIKADATLSNGCLPLYVWDPPSSLLFVISNIKVSVLSKRLSIHTGSVDFTTLKLGC